jgi:hypothetical protein
MVGLHMYAMSKKRNYVKVVDIPNVQCYSTFYASQIQVIDQDQDTSIIT